MSDPARRPDIGGQHPGGETARDQRDSMDAMADFLDDVFGDGQKRSAWSRLRTSLSPRRRVQHRGQRPAKSRTSRDRRPIPWKSIAAAAAPVLAAAVAFAAVLLGRPAAQKAIGFLCDAPHGAVLVASVAVAVVVLAVGVWRWARSNDGWPFACALCAAILAPALVFAEFALIAAPVLLVAEAVRRQVRR